jgi:hypothetical protein
MRLRTISVLAISSAVALVLIPTQAHADLLLDTGSVTSNATERDPGSIGFGQGVSVTATTDLTQFAMFLESPTGGNVKYMIWDGSNTNLLLSDIAPLTASTSPEWILSDPLSLTLLGGNSYYFGVIQDSNTELIAPFFFPPSSITENGLTTLDTGNSNYEDFLSPVFLSMAGGGFPLRLYGTQAIVNPVPEPSSALWLTSILLAGVWKQLSDRTHHATIHAQGRARDGRRQWTTDERHQRGNLGGRGEPFDQRAGTNVAKELALHGRGIRALTGGEFLDKICYALGRSRAREHGVHRHSRAGHGFSETARDCELGGFGHPVMNHIHGNLQTGFARNEDNASPVFFLHGSDIVPRETHAAEYVDFEEPAPIVIGDLIEWLRLKDAKIIYQDVDARVLRNQLMRSGLGSEIGRHSVSGSAGLHRGVDALLSAAVHDHRGAFLR